MDVKSVPGMSCPSSSSVTGRKMFGSTATTTTSHAGWLRSRRAMTKKRAIA